MNSNFGIACVGGHGLLYALKARKAVSDEEAEMQGLAPGDNVEWQPVQCDLTEDPPVEWNPWCENERHCGITFRSGRSMIIRTGYEKFSATYREWLDQRETWPQLN